MIYTLCHIIVAASVLVFTIILFVETTIAELNKGVSLFTLLPMGLATLGITACMVWLFLSLVNLLDHFVN